VIVYCYDEQCDMSPRAASRLESIGFEQVYDYTAGKADWGSFGLPLDGHADSSTRVGSRLRTDVPTCRLEDRLPALCQRLDESGWETCLVVDDDGVVLGRIGRAAIRGREDQSAEEAMTPGPSTVRPSARLDAVAERMQRQNLTTLPVTTPDGRLVGLIIRSDVEHRRHVISRSRLHNTASLRCPKTEAESSPDPRSMEEIRVGVVGAAPAGAR
jgi:CBS domain-containing protein